MFMFCSFCQLPEPRVLDHCVMAASVSRHMNSVMASLSVLMNQMKHHCCVMPTQVGDLGVQQCFGVVYHELRR